jgi:hypothetical protein
LEGFVNYRITAFATGQKYSLELEDFEPKGGYELFLKTFCKFIDEEFLDWHQGVMEGIGHITYRGYKLVVYWTDFPFALSFDCRDKAMAEELRPMLEAFFSQP